MDPNATVSFDETPGTPEDPIGLERYRFLRFLSSGGMGEVWLVRDENLHCDLAMKVVGEAIRHSTAAISRFQEEARITAQLAHPAIIPVHDLGILTDGRYYYTMPVVEGPRLADAFSRWFTEGERSGWSLHRLLDAFRRVCEAVGYAHSRGVIHRDLKPGNVMVGAHGEVLVLDWGLAKIVETDLLELELDDEEPLPGPSEKSISSLRSLRPDLQTRAGSVFGTPAYMAPEQARGEGYRAGPPADVYALGAMLWELLTGHPPALGMPLPSPTGPHAHPELILLATQALANDPEDRPEALYLGNRIAAWQAGAERREQALLLVAQADATARQEQWYLSEVKRLRTEAQALLAPLPALSAVEEKRPGWLLEEQADRCERQADLAHLEVQRLLGAALTQVPELEEAHDRLATIFYQLHRTAIENQDSPGTLRYEQLLRQHDRGRYREWLAGNGSLSLLTDPPGARVNLYRQVEQDRHLVPIFERFLGLTPLRQVALPAGSWLLKIEAEGRITVDYPVYIRRMEHWDGVRPGDTEPFPIYLPRLGEIGEQECYVPAGWFLSGGDPVAIYSLPARRLWVDAFVMQRFPVTHQQFLDWLNQLWAEGRREEAKAAAPRERPQMEGGEGTLAYGLGEQGFFLIPDMDGEMWNPGWPVFSVVWSAAMGFAADLADRQQKPWRLPADLEWEKAARGVDGRLYPWGNYLDPTFSRSMDSGPGKACPALLDEHPVDQSPYGVRFLAGNVRCWCGDAFKPEGGPVTEDGRVLIEVPPNAANRMLRGGSWSAHPRGGRSARRSWNIPTVCVVDIGIRLVRPL